MTAALLELADAAPAVEVQEAEYRRLLGWPAGHEVTGRSLELAAWARSWYAEHGRPWWYARQAASLALGPGRVEIEAAPFDALRLGEMLAQAEATSAMLVAVGAGAACEEHARALWEEGKPDEYFFLEVYGSAVVEALVAAAAFRLCEWADRHGLAVLPHYSPGYPDWDIADQARLLDLVGVARRRDLPEGVRALPTGMLKPKKSLLAVFGLTPRLDRVQRLTTLVPCANCSLAGCRYRRAPYRRPLRQLESVHPARAGSDGVGAAAAPGPLTAGARYSVAPAVLRRWARERLRLRVLGDRTVEAAFRYDGTTCSNMGQPLAFEYRIALASREEGYTITDLSCAPAEGDVGHKFMCEYLDHGDDLMRAIAGEQPLLGHPLDAVVGWRRGTSAAGCYCTASSREHKWGLALEVLHFALCERDAAPAAAP
ncbi:MAG TPA: hypothetical protein VEH83_09280 [Gemmatimonadales bacterium]|nr:hypothetical protein [Gemmatimonadales bacterium]